MTDEQIVYHADLQALAKRLKRDVKKSRSVVVSQDEARALAWVLENSHFTAMA